MYFKIVQRKCILVFFSLENMKTYWLSKTQVIYLTPYTEGHTMITPSQQNS